MRSKILVYIPSKFFDPDHLANQFKQIKELGFDQIVLDADLVLQNKDLEKFLLFEKLILYAICFEDFLDLNKSMMIMESAHSLNCPFILSDNIPAKESEIHCLKKMEESGLTILKKIDKQYFINSDTEPLIIQNPLAYSEKPLQSSILAEKEPEAKIILENKEKNIFFMISPDHSLEYSNYLRHCKDILNRYYFLGLR